MNDLKRIDLESQLM